MDKLFLNRQPVQGPWGGGNLFIRAIHDLAPEFGYTVAETLDADVNVILMVDPRENELGPSWEELKAFKQQHPSVSLLHRINECDARKNTNFMDELLRNCSQFTDASIFVSNWIRSHHLARGWHSPNNYVIQNGVNKQHFRPNSKRNDGRIHLVTHHWSNNPLKGFDIYDKLDRWIADRDDFTFTYIGRDNQSFRHTTVLPPLSGQALGEELGCYDVYISGSRYDPGPNHILESLGCQLPTYVHTEGGGCVEFAGKDHVFDNFDNLVKILEAKQFPTNSGVKTEFLGRISPTLLRTLPGNQLIAQSNIVIAVEKFRI